MSSEPQRKMPARIRITNRKGVSVDTHIEDADTGETLQGVTSVRITLSKTDADIIVAISRHWPITSDDLADNHPDDDDVEPDDVEQYILIERHTYQLKRLDLESW